MSKYDPTRELANKQHEQFCREYIIDLKPAKAYKRAGYAQANSKSAYVGANALLKKPDLQARIKVLQDERTKRTEITADRVLKELAVIGFSRITDYLTINTASVLNVKQITDRNKKKKPLTKKQEALQDELAFLDIEPENKKEENFFEDVYTYVKVLPTASVSHEAVPAIAAIKQGPNGIEIRLHDKVKALELMGQHLGITQPKDGETPPAPLTPGKVDELITEIRKAGGEKIIVQHGKASAAKQN